MIHCGQNGPHILKFDPMPYQHHGHDVKDMHVVDDDKILLVKMIAFSCNVTVPAVAESLPVKLNELDIL